MHGINISNDKGKELGGDPLNYVENNISRPGGMAKALRQEFRSSLRDLMDK